MKKIFTHFLIRPLVWTLLALWSLFFMGCSQNRQSQELSPKSNPKKTLPETSAALPKSQSYRISVMTYNVENLFDTKDDPNRYDETYLPKSEKLSNDHKKKCSKISKNYFRTSCLNLNWDEATLHKKMARLASVIKTAAPKTHGPDIVILEEVENLRVLKQLNDKFLKKANYSEVILLEGPDKRGIDIGILSRLPRVGSPELHPIDLDSPNQRRPSKQTRSILHSRFRLPDRKTLHVFGLHFPSQANPIHHRKKAVSLLKKLFSKLPTDEFAIAGGDFNITRKEDKKHKLFSKSLSALSIVSHLVGCKQCSGSHNYKGKWSFLDALLFSKNFGDPKSPWKLEVSSIRIANEDPIQNHPSSGRPARFDEGRKKYGVSDHWPVYGEIISNPVK